MCTKLKSLFFLILFSGLFHTGCISADIKLLGFIEKKFPEDISSSEKGLYENKENTGITISGVIIKEDSTFIKDALLSFIKEGDTEQTWKSLNTNSEGKFTIRNISEGKYKLAALAPGYFSTLLNINIQKNGERDLCIVLRENK